MFQTVQILPLLQSLRTENCKDLPQLSFENVKTNSRVDAEDVIGKWKRHPYIQNILGNRPSFLNSKEKAVKVFQDGGDYVKSIAAIAQNK